MGLRGRGSRSTAPTRDIETDITQIEPLRRRKGQRGHAIGGRKGGIEIKIRRAGRADRRRTIKTGIAGSKSKRGGFT